MCNYYKLAETDFSAANELIKVNDELYLSIYCYLLEQAIEKLLKHAIVLKEEKPTHEHDVVELYNKYIGCGWEPLDIIDDLSDTLTKWESARTFSATPRQVERAKSAYISLRDVVDGL